MSHSAETPVPTQVAHPWKAALRTGIQTFIGVAGVLVLAAPLVADFLAQQLPQFPGAVAFVTTAGVFVGALALLVSRIMAIPGVNDFLTKIGIGAAPSAPPADPH